MPKKLKLLTMDRSGEFKILTVGDSHCGLMTNQHLPVKYHMVCECEVTLDSRGFLFEQVGIDQFFQNLKRTKLSCEKLTMNCVERLITLIRKDNPVCVIRSIELTLSPFPHAASMTYTEQLAAQNGIQSRAVKPNAKSESREPLPVVQPAKKQMLLPWEEP